MRLDAISNLRYRCDDMNENQLLKAIIEAFERSGMSILQLSKKADLPYSCVHNAVTGRTDIHTATAARICDVLDLTLIQRRRKGKTRETSVKG